jgi:hypothetical protein
MKVKPSVLWTMFIIGLLFAGSRLATRIYAGYEYRNEVSSYWTLSERASTIAQKSEYMNKFVDALTKAKLEGTNANLIMQTPQSEFNENFKAVKSLQARLADISKMDETSFAYQTAIEQITKQEQGEAEQLLCEIKSCWLRVNWPTLWNPIVFCVCIVVQLILLAAPFKSGVVEFFTM